MRDPDVAVAVKILEEQVRLGGENALAAAILLAELDRLEDELEQSKIDYRESRERD